MRVTKNRWRGSIIVDLNELVYLAIDKQSVIVYVGGAHRVLPASFVINWSLQMILNMKIYHALDYAPRISKK